MKSSNILLQFYAEYAEWLDKGAPPPEHYEVAHPFTRYSGLCTNLYDWAYQNFGNQDLSDSLLDEIHDQFKEAGLSVALPFNISREGGEEMPYYRDETILDTCYCNPKRVQWVRDRLQDRPS